MSKFGFEIAKDLRRDLDCSDTLLFSYVKSRQPDILKCIGCGSCSATCPASVYKQTSFRRSILLLERGEVKELKSLIEGCMLCGKCNIVCPRGINTRDIILTINELFIENKL